MTSSVVVSVTLPIAIVAIIFIVLVFCSPRSQDDRRSWYEFGVFLPELLWRRITGAPPPSRFQGRQGRKRKVEGLTKTEIRMACPEVVFRGTRHPSEIVTAGLRFERKGTAQTNQKSLPCNDSSERVSSAPVNSSEVILQGFESARFGPVSHTGHKVFEKQEGVESFGIPTIETDEIKPIVEDGTEMFAEKRNSSKDSSRSTRNSEALSLVHVPAAPGHIFQFVLPLRWVTHETEPLEPYQVAEKEGIVLGSFYIPDEMCAVCLDPIMPGVKLRVLQCRHAFHSPCIEQWLRSANRCPLCNTPPIPVFEEEDMEEDSLECQLGVSLGDPSRATYWQSSAYRTVVKSYNARCWLQEFETT
ncbi:hypothetical protein Gasu2_36340 [Galdieria sulphuraria]|uniref:Ring finger protein-like protein n=1 Tax=Galdieria sulphuraria TaxID=130081 RepID=M2XB59_GALSU|nr:ring finger protein-like protein [Galdieria sulphuraria]EME27142.1 ring finger protein-like protein [Galdieria sulphuraria]GJD09377.1 hypothetical protein Gasu2_36340 [Galdieria sulphuraria]|eukprot:XP_005703662.1 ring finger protein-like protein [Galdieria sulphuraria]